MEQTRPPSTSYGEQDGKTVASRRSMHRGSPFAIQRQICSPASVGTNPTHFLCLVREVYDGLLVLDVGGRKQASGGLHRTKINLHTDLGEERRVLVIEELR